MFLYYTKSKNLRNFGCEKDHQINDETEHRQEHQNETEDTEANKNKELLDETHSGYSLNCCGGFGFDRDLGFTQHHRDHFPNDQYGCH